MLSWRHCKPNQMGTCGGPTHISPLHANPGLTYLLCRLLQHLQQPTRGMHRAGGMMLTAGLRTWGLTWRLSCKRLPRLLRQHLQASLTGCCEGDELQSARAVLCICECLSAVSSPAEAAAVAACQPALSTVRLPLTPPVQVWSSRSRPPLQLSLVTSALPTRGCRAWQVQAPQQCQQRF